MRKIIRKYKYHVLTLLIVTLFIFFRLHNLVYTVNIGSDQGMQLLEIERLYKSRKVSLIGPPSSLSVNGKNFFVGSASYYFPMIPLVLSDWNLFSVTYELIILQLVSMVTVMAALSLPKKASWYYGILFSTFPLAVYTSQFFWSPNFLIPVSGVTLALVISISRNSKGIALLTLGVLLGLGLQLHYSFFLTILLVCILLILRKTVSKAGSLFLFSGMMIGFLPIVIFEIRHDFYNTAVFFEYFRNNYSSGLIGKFQQYYLFTLIPFLLWGIAQFLEYMERKHRAISIILCTVYITWTMAILLPKPSHGYGMVEGWNYPGIMKIKSIIIHRNNNPYNIADLLTGDTRAMALRFLLNKESVKPLGETEYPSARFLYVYSRNSQEKIISGNLWEIDSIKPVKLVNTWHIQNGIYLYLLEKDTGEIKN